MPALTINRSLVNTLTSIKEKVGAYRAAQETYDVVGMDNAITSIEALIAASEAMFEQVEPIVKRKPIKWNVL